jgi:hypothetical protein
MALGFSRATDDGLRRRHVDFIQNCFLPQQQFAQEKSAAVRKS